MSTPASKPEPSARSTITTARNDVHCRVTRSRLAARLRRVSSVADPFAVFQMPTAVTITGRSSAVTNSFVNSIIPLVPPTADDIVEALAVLGMTPDTIACAYCGERHTEWDHLRPLVIGKRPTGYVSEIANLVPACAKCNQSKGNKPWETWISSTARLSPHTRGAASLVDRIERLRAFAQWREPLKVDFAAVVGEELWAQHWQHCDDIHTMMRTAQATAEQIRMIIRAALDDSRHCEPGSGAATRNTTAIPTRRGRWQDFSRWLAANGYDPATAGSRASNLKRVEDAYGDLDHHFAVDRCASVLAALAYTTADKDRARPNPSTISIDGDTYNGLATLRSALKLYIRFQAERSRPAGGASAE